MISVQLMLFVIESKNYILLSLLKPAFNFFYCYMTATANLSRILRFLPRTDGDFIQFWPLKMNSRGHKDEQQDSATTSV